MTATKPAYVLGGRVPTAHMPDCCAEADSSPQAEPPMLPFSMSSAASGAAPVLSFELLRPVVDLHPSDSGMRKSYCNSFAAPLQLTLTADLEQLTVMKKSLRLG